MKLLDKNIKFLKKRQSIKILCLLSISPEIFNYGVSIINNKKFCNSQLELYSKECEKFKYTYNGKIELSPVLLEQIEKYLYECKKN